MAFLFHIPFFIFFTLLFDFGKFNSLPSETKSNVQVKVTEGILDGEETQNVYGGKFYSFKGVPYAEPPIGDLRFKAPKDKSPWEGVRPAKQFSPKCYQSGLAAASRPPIGSEEWGNEDCLYLNIYTPEIKPNNLLPVMFWIHGGAFQRNSGNDERYGPEFLVRKGVILITMNYRLGALGFLSLGTADIPGNAGFKDQVAALRWVKKNIAQFGGDPENVTIFGQSAGGTCVSFHLVSPMSKGLFRRAISQSGTSLCWAANYMEPITRAKTLARQLGCSSDDNKEIYEFLKNEPVHSLMNTEIFLTYAEETKEGPGYTFGIVEEIIFDDVEAFWTQNIYEQLRNGTSHEGVEIINGYTADEGVLYITNSDLDRILAQANKFSEFFVPLPAVENLSVPQQLQVGKKLKSYYFGNKDVTKETLEDLVRFFNFDMFVYSSILWQKLSASAGKNTIFMYKFTATSERNINSQRNKVSELLNRTNTVVHGDDLPYIFPYQNLSPNVDMNSREFKMIEQVTTIWTNFAKYGEPTPDDSLGVRWTPYTLEGQDYLDIGEQLVPKTVPDKEDVEYWETVFREFYPEIVS